jgi:hypothetical protein
MLRYSNSIRCEPVHICAWRQVPRDTPSPIAEARGDWSDPPYTRPHHVARSFSNFSPAGTSHIRNWK